MIEVSKAHRLLAEQFFKFAIVGVIGLFVDYGTLWVGVHAIGLNPYIGRLFSFFFGNITTWICNRLFTFRGLGKGSAGSQWLRFMLVCAGGFVLNYGTYAFLVATVPQVHANLFLGVAAGSIAGMFFNFFFARKLVFR